MGPEFEAFARTLREHPEDDAARLVLIDWLTERPHLVGALFMAEYLREGLGHDDEDVSYHGSPIYECKYCGVGAAKWKNRPPHCAKAFDRKWRLAQEAEQKERYEYERMLQERRRYAYLRAKYGEEGDPL